MPDNSESLNPNDSDNIDGLSISSSKRVNPELIESIINAMDTVTSKAIDPEMLKTFSNTMDATLSRAIDPEMMKSLINTMDNAKLNMIDPTLSEKMGLLPISDFSIKAHSEFIIPIQKSYSQLSFEEQQDYNEKSLKYLEEIRNNTATLSTMIDLIAENNEKQDILLQILSQMLEIATAKNQEELNGKFERILDRIKNTIELGELTGKLLFYAYTIFSLVAPHIGK